MSVSLLNFGMLVGLIGIALPVLVHLLNRRRFDVVQWGAMQFLQLGERTRQKIQLSDLLLLLLRIALIALLVLAFTRPFVKGSLWIRSLHPEPVDLVIVIDSSYSMGWSGGAITPHSRAIQLCHEILDDLTSVDRVAIIDARDDTWLLTPAPLTDTANARLELEKIQQADGSANLVGALTEACQLLTQSFSSRRQILVLTDQQQLSWKFSEQGLWNDMLRLRNTAAVPIQIRAVDVSSDLLEKSDNFTVDQLELARELVVVGSEVSVSTKVAYDGDLDETTCELNWSVDGQQLSREMETLRLRRGEQTVVQFATRFQDAGSHTISASVSDDELPGDNVARAIVEAVNEIPVGLVSDQVNSGDPDQQQPFSGAPKRAADHYLGLAFGNPDQGNVWVDGTRIAWNQLSAKRLDELRMVFLIGTPPDDFDWNLLTGFLNNGGGVVVLPGPSSDAAALAQYAGWKIRDLPVLPMQYERVVDIPESGEPEKLKTNAFSGTWLERFGTADNSDLKDVLVNRYWVLSSAAPTEKTGSTNPRSEPETDSTTETAGKAEKSIGLTSVSVDARLQLEQPLFARRYVGRGQILVSAIPFDGQASDLVQQRAFVPLLHELVFGMTRPASQRNVRLGQPLVLQQLPCQPLTIGVNGPDETELQAQRAGSEQALRWVLPPTRLSGIYNFVVDCPALSGNQNEANSQLPFAVTAARIESNLQRLSAEQLDELRDAYGIRWQSDSSSVLSELASSSTGLEIWPLLLFIVTGFLVLELLLTKRLVQGGHAAATANLSDIQN